MTTRRIASLLPAIAFASLAAPSAAHAGRGSIFLILSTNPWILGIGIVITIVWFVVTSGD